ncbi:MAG: tripartite tricarboxylate transporter substrate binding protein [Candidatus Rokubacteria bacterium]|nr:tripartite tricarboxylate transporter substrate binding protein [Candidatus Rokubacteria bacterium]
MSSSSRRLALVLFIATLVGVTVLPASGQEKYPSRPIDFIVTWGTGGGADAMARTIGQHMQPILGVAIPASNVPGASGNTGLGQLLAAKADGYTIATYIMDTLATIPMGLAKYTVDDFEWIARTQVADSFFLVKSDSPYKTIQELLRAAKENPGKIRVAATGYGTVDDVTVRFFEKKGIRMTTVPYPKPGERYASTLGGHSEVLYEQAGDIAQYLKAGQLRPLIIFGDKRHPAFPDVPASVQLGYDIQLPQFRSIVTKKGVPADRVKILADAIRHAMETPAYKKFAEEWYFRPDSYMGSAEFGPWVHEQVKLLDQYVKEFGLKR